MNLYSLIVEHQGKSFSTQLTASSATGAVAEFFSGMYPHLREQAFGHAAPDLDSRDIIYVRAMTDLVNIWAATAGRTGQYVSLVCVLTAPQVEA